MLMSWSLSDTANSDPFFITTFVTLISNGTSAPALIVCVFDRYHVSWKCNEKFIHFNY